jgi:hypothetical protein
MSTIVIRPTKVNGLDLFTTADGRLMSRGQLNEQPERFTLIGEIIELTS